MISILSLLLQATGAPAPAPAPAAAPVAPWTVTLRPKTDPTITSTVAGAPSSDGNARIVVRCDSGAQQVVSVQFFTRTPLGGPPDRPVTLTIDGGTPMGANWEFVEKGAYIREDVAVTTITTALAKAKSIKLATTTAAGEPVNASFAGPPSAEPITKVLAACGYTLGTPPVRAPQPAPTPAKK
ncbi:MAG: hypothetical protein JSR79_13420 [Proteobacteria bacterium]|nr:hypothetical protein [Pseudomonadota bacterium]